MRRFIRTTPLRDERGITGLETAIVLIAFVVVAAVFAFVVLSTGVFSSERGRDAVLGGLQKTRGSMVLAGDPIATSNGTELTNLTMTFSLAAGGRAVDLSPSAIGRIAIAYRDTSVSDGDLTYTSAAVVGDADTVLENGEVFEVAVDLTQNAAIDIRENEQFQIEISSPSGPSMLVQRMTPGSVSDTIVRLR